MNRKDFMEFGDEVVSAQRVSGNKYASTPDEVRKDYTGYEKDEESGLEFAQARYYNPTHGRFTSVDPLTASATIRDPQSFNRYSYGLNSPYKFTDPLGLLSETASGACGNRCRNSDSAAFSGNSMVGYTTGMGEEWVQTIIDIPPQPAPPPNDPVLEAAAAAGLLCDPNFDYEAFAATLGSNTSNQAPSTANSPVARTTFNINLRVPEAWRKTDYSRRTVDEFGDSHLDVGFLRQLKNGLRAIFADAGVNLVFDNPSAASNTRNGSYNLEYREDFSGAVKLFVGKDDLGFTYPDKSGGQVSIERVGLYIPDLAAVGAHEAGHRFLSGFAGLKSGHGGGIMARQLGRGIRYDRFTPDQAAYLRSLGKQ